MASKPQSEADYEVNQPLREREKISERKKLC